MKWGCLMASELKVFWVWQFFKNAKVLMFFNLRNHLKLFKILKKCGVNLGGTFGGFLVALWWHMLSARALLLINLSKVYKGFFDKETNR